MKQLTIKFAIALCALAGITLWAEEQGNDPLNAVVRIETAQNSPNFALPWQNLAPQSGYGSGVVVEGKHILTNAHNVADSTMIIH